MLSHYSKIFDIRSSFTAHGEIDSVLVKWLRDIDCLETESETTKMAAKLSFKSMLLCLGEGMAKRRLRFPPSCPGF